MSHEEQSADNLYSRHENLAVGNHTQRSINLTFYILPEYYWTTNVGQNVVKI